MAKITVKQGDSSAISINSRTVNPTKISISGIATSSGSDKTYTHDQASASDTWVITHNLGKNASVTVVNSANTVILCEITYDSLNQVTLTFDSATAGKAYLN
jgi:hypothetical protein